MFLFVFLPVFFFVFFLFCFYFFFFFFFQAEDGIRDHCVTGVQTCALPICVAHSFLRVHLGIRLQRGRVCLRPVGKEVLPRLDNRRLCSRSHPEWVVRHRVGATLHRVRLLRL